MDRRLTERMIGAIVLFAAAVILIPEMYSGPKAPVESGADASASSTASEGAKLKTYTIDLTRPGAQSPVVEPPPRALPETPPTQPAKASVIEKPAESRSTPVETPPVAPVKLSAVPEASKAGPANSTETTKATKPSATKTAPASGSDTGWTIQVGSFGVRATSDRLAGELKHDGFPAFVAAFQAGNQTLYRVRVGPVRDRAAAEALLGKLKPQHPTSTLIPPT